MLGEPDFGILTQTEILSAGQRICSVTDLPVIVDADTGYGNAINVIRTVDELIRIGAGGMFLEDQVWLSDVGT
jgi:2-methylisocitrate lyase-like PEP mutase family enzyme